MQNPVMHKNRAALSDSRRSVKHKNRALLSQSLLRSLIVLLSLLRDRQKTKLNPYQSKRNPLISINNDWQPLKTSPVTGIAPSIQQLC